MSKFWLYAQNEKVLILKVKNLVSRVKILVQGQNLSKHLVFLCQNFGYMLKMCQSFDFSSQKFDF